jgi:hypothetical protein
VIVEHIRVGTFRRNGESLIFVGVSVCATAIGPIA